MYIESMILYRQWMNDLRDEYEIKKTKWTLRFYDFVCVLFFFVLLLMFDIFISLLFA